MIKSRCGGQAGEENEREHGLPNNLMIPGIQGEREESGFQLLSDMGVGHVQPNRICSNAMLAAFARAKPPQPHLVRLRCCDLSVLLNSDVIMQI